MDIHTLYNLIFRCTRNRRMKRFEKIVRLTDTTRIIDLGGTTHNWRYLKIRPPVVRVNIVPQGDNEDGNGQFTYEVGDACALRYPDRSFELAFSNSAIEHVGDYDRQRKFAREVCRVGDKVWVQTPVRYFFIEPHYLTLFVHWLPKSWQKWILPFASVRGLLAL